MFANCHCQFVYHHKAFSYLAIVLITIYPPFLAENPPTSRKKLAASCRYD